MSRLKEVAKFACGFEAFHALAHLYFWLSGTTLQIVWFTQTPTWHIALGIVHAVIAILLGLYAWRQPTRSSRA